MAALKYKDSNGNYQPIVGLNVQNEVVQTTGSSTTAVMSQKAVSDLVPAQASSSNQLADKNFVNSSIATATATYRGCYNLVSDLSLTTQASHGQIETALATKMTALSITPDNNDYAFVQIPTADATPTEIASVERYKFNGTYWSFEYTINNSGFTAAQWAAVNSSITSGLVDKLNTLFSNTQSTVAKVLGIDANGGPQNIGISDLASVLGVRTRINLYASISEKDNYVMLPRGNTYVISMSGAAVLVFIKTGYTQDATVIVDHCPSSYTNYFTTEFVESDNRQTKIKRVADSYIGDLEIYRITW